MLKGLVVSGGVVIGLFFLLPFLDRGLERRPWRRPIPVGGVFIVLIGLVWLCRKAKSGGGPAPAAD